MGITNFIHWIEYFRSISESPFSETNMDLPAISKRRMSTSSKINSSVTTTTTETLPSTCTDTCTQPVRSVGDDNKTKNLLCTIDLTQVLFCAYQSKGKNPKNKVRLIEDVYRNFERTLVSKIVSSTHTVFDTCLFCGKRSLGFGDWSLLASSRNDESVCRCCIHLKMDQLLQKLHNSVDLFKRKGINLQFVLMYDSRNLNPITRSVTSSSRYQGQENITLDNIKDWVTANKFIYKAGIEYNSHVMDDMSFIQQKGKKRNSEGEEQFSISENYFMPRYRYMVMETCLMIFCNDVFIERSWLHHDHREDYDFVSLSNDNSFLINEKNEYEGGFSIIVDAIPHRVLNLIDNNDQVSGIVFNQSIFENPNFIKLFYDAYNFSVGYYTHQIRSQLVRNNYVCNSKNERGMNMTDNEMSDDIEEERNSCFMLRSDKKAIYHYTQELGTTRDIGEADIKMIPYIMTYLKTIALGKKATVWVDSEDSDLVVIMLAFISNSYKDKCERVGPFFVDEKWIRPNDISYIMDMGIKKIRKGIVKRNEFRDEVRSVGAFDHEDVLWDCSIHNEKDVKSSESYSSISSNPKDSDTKDTGSSRFVDLHELYRVLHAHVGLCGVENLLVYILLSGGDYIDGIPGIRAKKLIKVYEAQRNKKPHLFGRNKESSLIKVKKYNDLLADNEDHHTDTEQTMSDNIPSNNVHNNEKNIWYPSYSQSLITFSLVYAINLPQKIGAMTKITKDALILSEFRKCMNEETIYDDLHTHILKNSNSIKMMDKREVVAELKRACWVLNYYLGCEQSKLIYCCDENKKDVTSIWGWRMIPKTWQNVGNEVFSIDKLKNIAEKLKQQKHNNTNYTDKQEDDPIDMHFILQGLFYKELERQQKHDTKKKGYEREDIYWKITKDY